jgi:hypothetical protein
MRIANAINDLRRPPSIIYSDTTGRTGLHTHTQSVQSVGTTRSWNGTPNAGLSPQATTSPHSPIAENGNGTLSTCISEDGGIGLGVPSVKLRPTQLSLSPSESNLHSKNKSVSNIPEEADEERLVMSEVSPPLFLDS